MPGGTSTNIVSAFALSINNGEREFVQKGMAAMQLPLYGTEEIAKLCVFLSSNNAASVNGACVAADEGK